MMLPFVTKRYFQKEVKHWIDRFLAERARSRHAEWRIKCLVRDLTDQCRAVNDLEEQVEELEEQLNYLKEKTNELHSKTI